MNTIIIDTREPFEYQASHVDGALNVPPTRFMADELPKELAGADHSDRVILYCRSGMRSNTVSHLLASKGFTNIVNGINEHHVRKLLESE